MNLPNCLRPVGPAKQVAAVLRIAAAWSMNYARATGIAGVESGRGAELAKGAAVQGAVSGAQSKVC